MKFIYKIPHGYFPGGVFRKYAPCVNASGWADNNFLVWVKSRNNTSSPT